VMALEGRFVRPSPAGDDAQFLVIIPILETSLVEFQREKTLRIPNAITRK
jgi:hypothetical protein